VAVTYHLNGKPISPSQIGGKSGTVQVTYKLTNVSSKNISACFEGFNGQQQHMTLSTPIPIIASLYLTVPKQATSFSAPGSSLSPTTPTVFVLWAASLFEPAGPLTKSFTFTMKTANATIPKASVIVDAVNPKTITGKAPAKSAAALGAAEAAVSKGVSAIRTALGAVQQRVIALQKITSSNDPPHATGPSPDAAVKADLATLGQSIAAVLGKLGTLRTSLGTTGSASTGLSKTAAAADTLVTTISADAATIATAINELTSQLLPPAAQNASREVAEFKLIVHVLHRFGPAARQDPQWPKLVADLLAARIIANKISISIADIQQFAQTVTGDVQTLRNDIASLKAKAAALEASAAALAALVKQVIRDRLNAVLDRFAALQARFAQIAGDIRARFAHVEALVSRARSRLAAAVAAAKQDLAKALSQGEQAAQADITQAQAKAAQTEAKIQHDVAQANFQYARLLALDEQAVLNQIPGGEAPNVSEQTGWYLYSLPGISGKSKRQINKGERHHSRSQRQHTRKERRKNRRAKIF
jgi:putative membrane protein